MRAAWPVWLRITAAGTVAVSAACWGIVVWEVIAWAGVWYGIPAIAAGLGTMYAQCKMLVRPR